jgi:predicted PhzF superfamily epimerase YddE/YHI9
LKLGVIGPQAPGSPTDFEVRGFVVPSGVNEDPVTGSLNAGLAVWLMQSGLAPERYSVTQGTALGRAGRVSLHKEGDTIWVGGAVSPCVEGRLSL